VEPKVKAILDTSIVVASGLPRLSGDLAVSAATLAELHFGVLIAKNDEIRAIRLRRFGLVEKMFHVLPLDEQVAASYGRLATEIAHRGRKVRSRTMDLIIAATAHAHDAKLLTRNVVDFHGLEDLVQIETI
jgi:toxin FitB